MAVENQQRHTLGLLTLNEESATVKKSELIAGEKEVQEDSPFTYGSVETERKYWEVLECQLVIVS